MINTSSISPLMIPVGLGLLDNRGIDVNRDIDAAVGTLMEGKEITASQLGISPQGILVFTNDAVYDWHIVSNVVDVTDANGSTTGSTITKTAVLDYISPMPPDSWAIDGVGYTGSITAFGSMVASRVGSNTPRCSYSINFDTETISRVPAGQQGKYGRYAGSQTSATMGSTSNPALTLVFPPTGMVGNLTGSFQSVYDTHITKPMGSTNGVDMAYFISTFTQIYGWLAFSNVELNATRNSEKKSFSDFRVKNYQDYVSHGWLKYKTGNAIKAALINIGTMTDSIYTGKFGTVGAVVYVLLGRGLGYVGGLARTLNANAVSLADIHNPMYEELLVRTLSGITSTADLQIIQETLESSIPNMTSPMDYIDIAKAAGMTNDSEFRTFAEVGVDLYNKYPYMSVNNGADIVKLVDKIESPIRPRVEELAGTNSLLSSSYTDTMRSKLPVSETDETVTLFDVIGSSTGYLVEYVTRINTAIDTIRWTAPFQNVWQALVNIIEPTNTLPSAIWSASYSGGALVGTADPTTVTVNGGSPNTGAIGAFETAAAALANPAITDAYSYIAYRLSLEVYNYNLSGILPTSYRNDTIIMGFANGMHGYAVDTTGINPAEYLSSVASDDAYGDGILSLITEGKNHAAMKELNIQPNTFVG